MRLLPKTVTNLVTGNVIINDLLNYDGSLIILHPGTSFDLSANASGEDIAKSNHLARLVALGHIYVVDTFDLDALSVDALEIASEGALQSTSGPISTSGSVPPIHGQVLTASGSAAADWQTPGSGGLAFVTTDTTLDGNGTVGLPLGVSYSGTPNKAVKFDNTGTGIVDSSILDAITGLNVGVKITPFSTAGRGGSFIVDAGVAASTGPGGYIYLNAGDTSDTSGGGPIEITAGDEVGAMGGGGPINLTAGSASTSGSGGQISLSPGTGAGGGINGKILLNGTIAISDGTAGPGKVLTSSDAGGVASWQASTVPDVIYKMMGVSSLSNTPAMISLLGIALPDLEFGLAVDAVVVVYSVPNADGSIASIRNAETLDEITPITHSSITVISGGLATGRLAGVPALFGVVGTAFHDINMTTGVMSTAALFDVATFTSFGTDTLDNIDFQRIVRHIDTRGLIWISGTLNGGTDSFYGAIDPNSPTDFVAGSYVKLGTVTSAPYLAFGSEVAGKSTVAVLRTDGSSPYAFTVVDEAGALIYTFAGGIDADVSSPIRFDEVSSQYFLKASSSPSIYVVPFDLSSSSIQIQCASGMAMLAAGNGRVFQFSMSGATSQLYYASVTDFVWRVALTGGVAPFYSISGNNLVIFDGGFPVTVTRVKFA